MKILWHIPSYVPHRKAGSEIMTASVNDYLASKGHEIAVVVHQAPNIPFSYVGPCGELVITDVDEEEVNNMYAQADVVMNHLDSARKSRDLCAKHNKPMVHWHHINEGYLHFGLKAEELSLLVHNSQIMADQYSKQNHLIADQHVCIPPVYVEDYRVERTSQYITLVNLSLNKGVGLLIYLAKARPDYHFLGVVGGYGKQEIASLPPNVTIVEHTPDIKKVYQHTAVLLCPSKRETWGRVAVEAMCSGIPVLGGLTGGLMEAIGKGGFVMDINRPKLWLDLLDRLLGDEEFYASASEAAYLRAIELEHLAIDNLESMETKLNGIVSSGKGFLLGGTRQNPQRIPGVRASRVPISIADLPPTPKK